jgi:hypothetical protein
MSWNAPVSPVVQVLTVVDLESCCGTGADGAPDPSVMWQIEGFLPAEIEYGVPPEGAVTLVPPQPLVRSPRTTYWFGLRMLVEEQGLYCSSQAEVVLE